jgi:DNA-binding beta-propeller fold protein YncE
MGHRYVSGVNRRRFLAGMVAAATMATVKPPRVKAATLNPGDLLVSDVTNGCIVQIAPATGAQSVIAAGGNLLNPAGIALDVDGSLLIAESGAAKVIRIDPETGGQTVVSVGGYLVRPWGIAVTLDGTIIIADRDAAGGAGGIITVDPTTGLQTLLAFGGRLSDPVGVALDRHGFLFIADREFRGILRVHPKNGKQLIILSEVPDDGPYAIAIAANGDIYLTTVHHDGGGGIGRVIESEKKRKQRIVSTGGTLFGPYGIDIALDGSLFVTEADAFALDGGVLKIDPTTGAQTTITAGGNLREPIGIVIA